MLLDKGMDSGPILATENLKITLEHNTQTLTEELFQIGSNLLVSTIPLLVSGQIVPTSQNKDNVTITKLLTKDDGNIDWEFNSEDISRQIRAFNPWPSAFTYYNSKRLIIEKAFSIVNEDINQRSNKSPGLVTQFESNGEAITGVICGDGILAITQLKLEGSSSQDITEFVRGKPSFLGSILA